MYLEQRSYTNHYIFFKRQLNRERKKTKPRKLAKDLDNTQKKMTKESKTCNKVLNLSN